MKGSTKPSALPSASDSASGTKVAGKQNPNTNTNTGITKTTSITKATSITKTTNGHGNKHGDEDDNDEDEEDELESGDVFEVECVVGHKRVDGQGLYYFMKWKGYPDSDRTWEHESATNCPEEVSAYWNRYTRTGRKLTDKEGYAPKTQPGRRRGGSANGTSNDGKTLKSSGTHNRSHLKSNEAAASQEALFPDLTPLTDQTSSRSNSAAKAETTTATTKKRVHSQDHNRTKEHNADHQKRAEQRDKVRSDVVSSSNSAPHKSKGTESATATAAITTTNSETNSPDARYAATSKRARTSSESREQSPLWQPPLSWTSWEEHVDQIEAVELRETDEGKRELMVHLLWKAGHSTEHLNTEVHWRCPRKLCMYYETHLMFKDGGS
ncbi:hypothetical protein BGZ99_008368 [Dissophora globulifera]|uniref:Chromo domain-containing protein n=1 Tax=Dissophora globulifera TaxID=979702 RepID=A0A9P6UNJ3_9FUNG|nr:hypothetical protein BGZ99_008368 [Dissophora globulifera]